MRTGCANQDKGPIADGGKRKNKKIRAHPLNPRFSAFIRGKENKSVINMRCRVIMMTIILFCLLPNHMWAETKRALLIGIEDYESVPGLVPLKGPGNDIRLVKHILMEKLDFEEQNIEVLRNKQATHTGLRKAFEGLAQKIKQGDFIYIHYCGHGSQVRDRDGDEYPREFDQTWVPYGSRRTDVMGIDAYDITDDELHGWLDPIMEKTERVVFVSDCCHSGSVSRGDVLTPRAAPVDTRDYPQTSMYNNRTVKSFCGAFFKKRPAGGILIGAVQDDGLAYEAPFEGETHGLFSWYWAQALGRARPGDTWGDLFERAGILVTNFCDRQRPQFQGDRDQPVLGGDSGTKRPRIAVSRVSADGKRVRIEAGVLSGVSVGTVFRLYGTPEIEQKERKPPVLEITRVKAYYSEAAVRGIETKTGPETKAFKVGDLVVESDHARADGKHGTLSGVREKLRLKKLEDLDSQRPLKVSLWVTPWQRIAEPVQGGTDIMEVPGNLGWFKKGKAFNPVNIEKKKTFPPGTLLTFGIKNSSRSDFYMYLLDIMENGKVEAVFPSPGDRAQRALLPGGMDLDLKDSVMLLLDRPGKETIKLIITEAPIDITLWEQEGFKQGMSMYRGRPRKWGTVAFEFEVSDSKKERKKRK